VIEDPSLPHQILLTVVHGRQLAVSCNCMRGRYLCVKHKYAEHEALDIYHAHLRSAGA
jgi:hypothetical protein